MSTLPKKQAEVSRQFIPRIDYLSVREQSGQKLIKELIGIDAKLVCDPTLLLTMNQWGNLVEDKRIIKEKYIFCYFLGDNQFSRECADFLRKKIGYKIVALQHLDMYIRSDTAFADEAPYQVDPDGFVNLIRHAEFICTDSFHGTVFSLIHHKNFFTFRRFWKASTMSTNSRIDSLLNVLGCEYRLVESTADFKNALHTPLDVNSVEARLNDFRKDSLTFLEDSLQGLN